VPDKNCTNCDGVLVDNSQARQTEDQLSQRAYGSALLEGYTFEDKVCLTSSRSSCVNEFEYFAFVAQQGISKPVEGILGLC